MSKPHVARYLIVGGLCLLVAAITVAAAVARGHRWFPEVVIRWSPDPDQVIRATFVAFDPPRQRPGDMRPILIAHLARFSPERIWRRAEGSITRELAAVWVLKSRALGLPDQGIAPDGAAERVLARLADGGSPTLCGYLLTDHFTLREGDTPMARRWALAMLDLPDPEVHALAVRILLNPCPTESDALRARIVTRLRADVTYEAQVNDFTSPRFIDLASAMDPAVRIDGAPLVMTPWTPEKVRDYQELVRTFARMGLERYGEPVP